MTTVARIKKVIHEITGIAEKNISDHSYFGDDLALSSLRMAELLMGLEHEFKIDIPGAMSHNISVQEMAVYIDSAVKRKQEKLFHKPVVLNFALFNLAQEKTKR